MEFVNLTPFAAQAFGGLDTHDREYHVIVMRVGYRLAADARVPGLFEAQVIDDEPVPLAMADACYGEDNLSSPRAESDLAPYKPRCDLVLLGHAHAPHGLPARHWDARLRLGYTQTPPPPPRPIEPQPLNPLMTVEDSTLHKWQRALAEYHDTCARLARQIVWREVVLDKTLRIHGPRRFRHGLGHWSVTPAEAAASVPLRWEHAYGGTSRVIGAAGETLLDEACYANPLGCGWIEAGWLEALERAGQSPPDRLPAPQIEYPQQSQRTPDFVHQPRGIETAAQMAAQVAEVAARLGHRPAGFGWVGRAWAPRLARAGTYDQTWLDTRWPYLPTDFDFRYWNGAPDDQQIAFPDPGFTLELTHLADPARVGADVLIARLPAHRAFLRVMMGELGLPIPMQIDTVVVDADALRVDLVWRGAVLRSMEPDLIEARFETDPAAPLIKYRTEGEPA